MNISQFGDSDLKPGIGPSPETSCMCNIPQIMPSISVETFQPTVLRYSDSGHMTFGLLQIGRPSTTPGGD
jgi:hypothetical protein